MLLRRAQFECKYCAQSQEVTGIHVTDVIQGEPTLPQVHFTNLSIPVPFIGLRQACDSHVGARGLWLCAQHLHSNCARRRSIVNAQHTTVVFLNVESLIFQTTQHSSHLV